MTIVDWPITVRKAGRVLGVLTLMAAASGVMAQRPDTPRAPDPAATALGRPPGIQLTEAQKLVFGLEQLQVGVGVGWPSYSSDSPMPSADPRDFQGAWNSAQNLEIRNQYDMYGLPTPYTMAGAQAVVRRVNGKIIHKPYVTPAVRCLPPGPLWQLDISGGIRAFQGENWLEFIFGEFHGRWNIALDPKLLPPEDQKEYGGRSIAHWDGNTLVVETSNLKQDIWLDSDGTPLSKNGKLITRIRKVNSSDRRPYLEMIFTIVDPVHYTHEWSMSRVFAWAPNRALLPEYNCEEQVGDPSGVTDNGFRIDTGQ